MLRIGGATLLTGFLFLMTDVSNCLIREFVLYTEKTTWNDAYLKCEQDGGQLLELYSIEEDFVLEELMKDEPTDDIWIGLSTDDKSTETESDFKFANCKPLSWSNWDGGFKKDDGKPCVRIKKDTRAWYREICSQESNFICDIPKGECTYETQSRTCPTTVEDKEIFKNIIPTNEDCKNLCETKIRNGKKCYAYHFSSWCVLHHSSDPYFCETSYGNVVMQLRRCYSFRVSSNAVSLNHVSDLPEARTCTIYDPNSTTGAAITSTTKTTSTTTVSTTSTTTTQSTTSSATTTTQPVTSPTTQPTTSSINTTFQPTTSNTTDQITISNTTTQSTTSATLPTSSSTTTQFSSSITPSTNLTATTTSGQLGFSTDQFSTTSLTTSPTTSTTTSTLTSSEVTTNESTVVLESESISTVGSSTTSQSTEYSTAETTGDESISTSQTMTTASSTSSEATADAFTTVLESESLTTVGSSTTSQSQTTEYSTAETIDDTSISTSQTMTTATATYSEANTNDSTTPLESESTATVGGLTTTQSTVYSVIRTTTEAGQSEVCICDLCGKSNMTAIEEKMKQVRNDLKVNNAELSSTRRKKESAPDERPSAQNIGYIGIILFVVLFGSIILSDTRKIYSDIKNFKIVPFK